MLWPQGPAGAVSFQPPPAAPTVGGLPEELVAVGAAPNPAHSTAESCRGCRATIHPGTAEGILVLPGRAGRLRTVLSKEKIKKITSDRGPRRWWGLASARVRAWALRAA